MSKNLYRLEVVSNRLGIVHLRLKPPRGSEIILSPIPGPETAP